MHRCLGCMREYKDEYQVCPYCGYEVGTPPKEAYHMVPGTLLAGRYTVGQVLGFGGFGVTYIGYDNVLERKVAIKEYLPSEFSTRIPGQTEVTTYAGERTEQFNSGLTKFLDEAKTLAKLQSANGVVQIYNSFQENNTAYIVMEYLEGKTLKTYLEETEKIPVEEAKEILHPIITALKEVHALGIIHRDIAPDNIFLTNDGRVKLLDFGASRFATTSHSKSLSVIIKQGYAPVEQYRSRGDQGPWTDVYAMAAVIYRCIMGNPPAEISERIYQGPEKKTLDFGGEISKRQESVLAKGMAVFAKDRYQTMEEFQRDLRQSCAGEKRGFIPGRGEEDLTRAFTSEKRSGATGTVRSADMEQTGSSGAKKWIPVAGGVAALAAVAVIGGFLFMNSGKGDPAKEEPKAIVAEAESKADREDSQAAGKTAKTDSTESDKASKAEKVTAESTENKDTENKDTENKDTEKAAATSEKTASDKKSGKAAQKAENQTESKTEKARTETEKGSDAETSSGAESVSEKGTAETKSVSQEQGAETQAEAAKSEAQAGAQSAPTEATPGQQAAASQSAVTSAQVQTAQPEYTTMYVVNCHESITLRPEPSTGSGEICQIPFGAAVSYMETAENGFYKIIYNGRTGYGLAAYLDREPQSKPAESGDPVQVESAPAVSAQTLYVVNCNESITLRTSPNTGAGEICQIPLGAAVSFLGEAGNGFYTIQYNGQTGYALASYLSGAAAVSTSSTTMQVVNCNESITLRKIPDTDGEEICQIPLGATVTFLSQAENGFYMISYNGQTGYSLAGYLS